MKFRIKEFRRGGLFFYTPQEKFLGFIWINIFYKDAENRGHFLSLEEAQGKLKEHVLKVG